MTVASLMGSPAKIDVRRSGIRTVIVIVAYHSDAWLPECVRTLAESWNAQDRLLLVDNSGNSLVASAAREIPGTTLIATPRPLGFAEANNFGLVRGGLDGEYVCFLNQDTRSNTGWLDACVECLAAQPDVGAVLPLLRTYDGDDWDAGFKTCCGPSAEFQRDAAGGRFAQFYEVPEVSAAALVVRTAALQAAGPFDPIFGSYYEDYDLCRRIRGAGYRVGICGLGVVRHYNGSSTTTAAARVQRMRQIIRNRVIHRVRSAEGGRVRTVLDQFVRVLPWNTARGLARTASSQPVHVQLHAHLDLMRIIGRLLFERQDRRAWSEYLSSIGWEQAPLTGGRRTSRESAS